MSNSSLTTITDTYDLQYDNIYPSFETKQQNKIKEALLKQNEEKSCCDRICVWWFLHSSFGLNKSENIKNTQCICCDMCSWCCEFRINCKCCVKECACCCFSCIFQ